MGAFPKNQSGSLADRLSGNTRQAGGQCGTKTAAEDRKILPRRHQLPGAPGYSSGRKPAFIGFLTLARRLLISLP